MNWKWLSFNVGLPIFGPVVFSALVAWAWQSLTPGFEINPEIILNVSPWALTFFAMTLIGSTLNDFWPRFDQHKVVGWFLMGTALAVAVYTALIVVKRHDANFVPGESVYVVTVVLFVGTVILCYLGYSASRK